MEVAESGSGGSTEASPARNGRRRLRGSRPARVDDKGRLKVPAEFRSVISEKYGNELYVTRSLDAPAMCIYPLEVWEALETAVIERLARTDPLRRKFLRFTGRFAQTVELDPQGRVLIPGPLRAFAEIVGEVEICGHGDHLEVWNKDRYEKAEEDDPLTKDNLNELAKFGV